MEKGKQLQAAMEIGGRVRFHLCIWGSPQSSVQVVMVSPVGVAWAKAVYPRGLALLAPSAMWSWGSSQSYSSA